MSRVTCQMSHVTCHMSCVTCQMSHVKVLCFFLQIGEAYWWTVCYQRGLPLLVYNDILNRPRVWFSEKLVISVVSFSKHLCMASLFGIANYYWCRHSQRWGESWCNICWWFSSWLFLSCFKFLLLKEDSYQPRTIDNMNCRQQIVFFLAYVMCHACSKPLHSESKCYAARYLKKKCAFRSYALPVCTSVSGAHWKMDSTRGWAFILF